jgi:hypothetical protein
VTIRASDYGGYRSGMFAGSGGPPAVDVDGATGALPAGVATGVVQQ